MSPQISRSNKTSKFAILILVILFFLIGSSKFVHGPFADGGQVLGISFPNLGSFFDFTSTFKYAYNSEKLEKIVQKDLNDKPGHYSVFISDLTEDETYVFNSSEPFPAASLYKLFLLAAVFQEIENGNLSLETELTTSKAHLTEVLGSVDFGYEDRESKIVYTVDEATARVGRISDNFASIMLAEKIGWDKVQQMADHLGATTTRIKTPISTTSSDIGQYLKLLYQKQIVSPEASSKIEDILLLSKINDRLPAKLPTDLKVVHKTGELPRVRHDAGIVYLQDRPYLIVLMSKDLQYEDDGIETLSQISKDIYDYFKNKGK